ncbi:hypothetical protein PHYPSEUDO_002140 [Phytophthora pseudosyringae]|uniref:Uncharacterized protein n=1 Tax=Phytophthora pseudosyringae TaxID=221518 RepID=A0A8T1VY52_9STRA|nr:hypothetical protein PHYPSEUDO_002140 [Phytophthora pseudosyringae]
MDFSSSSNPNIQDNLPPETLERAHEENATRVDTPEPQHPSEAQYPSAGPRRDDDSDFPGPDTNQRSRKKQKIDSSDNQAQIEKLQQEIAEAKQRLATPQQHSSSSVHELGKSCIEAKQTAATMRRKLAEHSHWLQRVSSLMETAPLFDYAVGVGDSQQSEQAEGDATLQRSMDALDEWRGESKAKPHPRLFLDERLRAAVTVCQENASKLLRDATENAPTFQLSLRFESHGWKIATGTLLNDQMGFSCHRVLPAGLSSKMKEVAMAFWNFVERDEIFRTFVPLVQDSIITHQEADCSLSCRVLQLSQEANQQAAATVESINSALDRDGQVQSWQISMEAVHDHYLCTFVADAAGDSVIQNTAPPVKLDLGLQMSKLNMHNKFIMGARVAEVDEGVDLFIAGSARFDLPSYRDPAFDLLQHFVSHLPVYEDLHLTPLSDYQDKSALE